MKFGNSVRQIFKNSNHLYKNKLKNYEKINSSILMRDYIERKLYFDNEGYYGASNSKPIGRLEKPIRFKEFFGVKDYNDELNKIYPKSTWLTCSELLRPYFGYAIGSYIIATHKRNYLEKKNIKIFEIGCGMGGSIDSILEYMKNFNGKEYRKIEYVGIELSESLRANTEELLKKNHPELYANGQITLLNESFFDFDIEDNKKVLDDLAKDNVYILAFNLIDSLPHDRIKIDSNFSKIFENQFLPNLNINSEDPNLVYDQFKAAFLKFLNQEKHKKLILESHVSCGKNTELDNTYNLLQEFIPLNDNMIKEMLCYNFLPQDAKDVILGHEFKQIEKQIKNKNEDWFFKFLTKFNNKFFSNEYTWLPTTSIEFFMKLNAIFPSHKLILLDYDMLPSFSRNSDYTGKNSPEVYSIKENSMDSITHKSIFASHKTVNKPVNIYFPVDFDLMQLLYKLITGQSGHIHKFNYFMEIYSFNEWCETKSGFNPLMDTHKNMSFLISN